MVRVELQDAQRSLPRLVDRALRGEAVFIAVGEQTLQLTPTHAEVRAVASNARPGRGAWKGRVVIPDTFYEAWTAEEMGEQED